MPDLFFSQALTASQVGFRPLANWRFRRVPYRALITVLLRATGVSARATVMSGTTEILQRSPVQAGGTAGVIPSPLNTPVVQFIADGGDELDLAIDEVAAATPTVDGWINVEPAE